VLDVGDEASVGLRRNHPLLFEMRLENVFFECASADRVSLAFWTMFKSTFSSSRLRFHLA
jgi:hypothetical protein